MSPTPSDRHRKTGGRQQPCQYLPGLKTSARIGQSLVWHVHACREISTGGTPPKREKISTTSNIPLFGAISQRQLVFRVPIFSGTGDINGTTTGQGTSCLADTTANAKVIDQIRLPHLHLYSSIIKDDCRPELNRLVRCRAVLFTDNTGNSPRVGQADITIKPGMANLGGMLFRQT